MADTATNAAPAAVNLAGFLPADTFDIDILAADGTTETGWTVTLAGPSHPQSIESSEKIGRKMLRQNAIAEAARINGKKHKPDEREIQEVRRENIGAVVDRIVGWNPIDIGDGPAPFSPANALDLLSKPEMGWAFVQISDGLTGDAAFIKRAVKTS